MASIPRNFDTRFAYHIYNCGVEKRSIFTSVDDYGKFKEIVTFYKHLKPIKLSYYNRLTAKEREIYIRNYPPSKELERIKIIAYCLMPNHFHLMIRTVSKYNPSEFVSDIQNSYTKYFNIKNERMGSLFQGRFKSRRIDSNASVINLSRYIHLNPVKSSKTNKNNNPNILDSYPHSSYKTWALSSSSGFLDTDELDSWISLAGGRQKYKEFVTAGISLTEKIDRGIEKTKLEKSMD
ncbi:MAG: transposase [Patescibacteria group bacterium]